jgi:hypothetical protein
VATATIEQFPVLLILLLHHLPLLVGDDLPLGVGALLARVGAMSSP